jgi:hypothetical protein
MNLLLVLPSASLETKFEHRGRSFGRLYMEYACRQSQLPNVGCTSPSHTDNSLRFPIPLAPVMVPTDSRDIHHLFTTSSKKPSGTRGIQRKIIENVFIEPRRLPRDNSSVIRARSCSQRAEYLTCPRYGHGRKLSCL